MSQDQDATVRRCQRVIRMVSELHRLGYQRMRIMPYFHPLAFRLAIGPADAFSGRNGAYAADSGLGSFATYSSASQTEYFGWKDARQDTARLLADKFIARFPVICSQGQGRDWEYAGWLAELMGVLERRHALPFVMEEFFETPPEELDHLPLWRADGNRERYALPPAAPRLSGSQTVRSLDLRR